MVDLVKPPEVSNFLLLESRESGEVLTNLKLQKLIYYAQAWHLALYRDPLFSGDFQAWVHGPVLPSQYHRFSSYRWKPIMEEVQAPELGERESRHLGEVLAVFGSESAIALEQMTHQEKPWMLARGGIPSHQPSQEIIRKERMATFYREMSDANQEEEAKAAF